MSSKKVTQTLGKQHTPTDPLYLVLRGAVARLDYMVAILGILQETAVQDNDTIMEPDNPLIGWKSDTEEFLTELGLAGLFQGMVLKVQKPISSSVDEPLFLVYNEDRSLLENMTMDSGVHEYFGEAGSRTEHKVFMFARLWADGTLQMVAEAEWRDW